MAEKETTVAQRLEQLYRLQIIDSELDEIEILKGELPMEVNDMEDEIAGLQTRQSKLEQQIAEIEHEISQANAYVIESEASIQRYKVQMDQVKNNREFEALTKEIDTQSLEIQLAQKRVGKIKVDLEAKQETLNATKERIKSREANLNIKKGELDEIIAKTDKEEKRLKKKSETERKKIEDRFLLSYDRIRSNYRNNLAVVPVRRGSCGGCFNYIPPQQQLEIGLHKKIIACEHCGRIMVDSSIVTMVNPDMVESEA
jgi:predicted  nucleic acid-binding Zn-ribbon protein